MIDAAKAQRIQRSDGPGAHGKNVPQNTADASSRPLIRLYKRRMVVAFHLECHCQTIADIDHSGVFTGALKNMRPFGWQTLQVLARALVATVLRPHNREHAELGIVGFSSKNLNNLLVLIRHDSMARNQLSSNLWLLRSA